MSNTGFKELMNYCVLHNVAQPQPKRGYAELHRGHAEFHGEKRRKNSASLRLCVNLDAEGANFAK
jgi:hypothetical protein